MMKRTVIALGWIVLATSVASGDWIPASLSGGVFEGFDGAMAEDDTTVPVFAGAGFFQTDTYWQVTQADVDVSMSLGRPGSFPSDGGYNMGTTQAVHGENDRALGAYAADSSARSVSLKMINDTAEVLDEFFVQFDIERWMTTDTSKAGRARLVLEQGQTETTLVDFVTIAGVSQPFWDDAAYGEDGYGWVDGNADINSVRELGGMVDLTAVGVAIDVDEVFTLRWDLVEEGNSQAKATGLAVDNILVAVPEPATLGILLVGAASLLGRARKR